MNFCWIVYALLDLLLGVEPSSVIGQSSSCLQKNVLGLRVSV